MAIQSLTESEIAMVAGGGALLNVGNLLNTLGLGGTLGGLVGNVNKLVINLLYGLLGGLLGGLFGSNH